MNTYEITRIFRKVKEEFIKNVLKRRRKGYEKRIWVTKLVKNFKPSYHGKENIYLWNKAFLLILTNKARDLSKEFYRAVIYWWWNIFT